MFYDSRHKKAFYPLELKRRVAASEQRVFWVRVTTVEFTVHGRGSELIIIIRSFFFAVAFVST